METIICLIRHGQTDWNKQKRIQGRINNQLNDTGKTQVEKVGKILKEQDPFWDIIIASPLDRAIDSAKIIAKELNYSGEIIINNNVIEREFGEAEGEYITDEIYDKITKDVVKNLENSSKVNFDNARNKAKTLHTLSYALHGQKEYDLDGNIFKNKEELIEFIYTNKLTKFAP